jgi:hypothetical protein
MDIARDNSKAVTMISSLVDRIAHQEVVRAAQIVMRYAGIKMVNDVVAISMRMKKILLHKAKLISRPLKFRVALRSCVL